MNHDRGAVASCISPLFVPIDGARNAQEGKGMRSSRGLLDAAAVWSVTMGFLYFISFVWYVVSRLANRLLEKNGGAIEARDDPLPERGSEPDLGQNGVTEESVIRLVCPGCHRRLQIPMQYVGMSGKCNHCGAPIQAVQR